MAGSLGAIGDIIRNGIVFDFKNWDQKSTNDGLKSTVARLFSLLDERQVDYVLVGGVALLQYIEGRNTQDIDLIMALSSLEKLPEIQLAQRDENFIRGTYDGLQLALLLTHNPLFARVQRIHTTSTPFAERTIMTASVRGLILLKLYALPSLYRQGDFVRVGLYENDVATLMYAYQPDTDSIIDELKSFVSPSDLEEIRNIVADLQTRYSRFGR
ncbi:MAG: hypothetical protein DCC51_13690 [Anaerolineae bacterium]|nr:MAG: hypothetical protein DCC51_13690 [Anaerolineae bacterium]